MRNTLIFAGNSCPALTGQICGNLGMQPAEADLTQFSNGETSVRVLNSVREKDVFIVQSGSSSINDSIMELLILINACKGGSANKVTAVLPYFPYNRQSKKKSHRGAIAARLLANLLMVAGVKHVITVDLHASQMQGFFRCPVDNLHAEPIIAKWIRRNVPGWREAVVVSKNAGGTKRVTSLADALKLNFGMTSTAGNSVNGEDPMAMSHHSTMFLQSLGGSGDAEANVSDDEEHAFENPKVEHMITLVGDVKNRIVFIVDDMIDKAGSWIAAAETVVKRGGAKKVYCIATHGVFGGDSLAQLEACDCIDTIVVTNSFPISEESARGINKLVVLDLSFMLSEAIRRNHFGESLSPLFQHYGD
ncbi:ribose-phosphate pyrophosphokinase [Geosmithia morbida]|uniref:Ribose-phosphate pyrophosphokinase 1 n=1 Tax=Geosmithia morbida TaxID=1094350 RepID=A0A9P4Z0V4_9HYPO|nr:ribose-phosphate pyrophosphokinase [Geosmithia morbida]KAF4125362.1 ribose-phosphate pyrophosphokinase [Geosmithia morbida]